MRLLTDDERTTKAPGIVSLALSISRSNRQYVFKEKAGYQELGFLTWEQFCETRLQTTADKLAAEATDRVVSMANSTNGMNSHGGDRQSDNFQPDNYPVEAGKKYGTSAKVLTARIARDRPDILEDMKLVCKCHHLRHHSRFLPVPFCVFRARRVWRRV